VLAGGAVWEAGVLPAMADAGIVVTKRCVDVPDLMAAASAGGAAVAVVAGDLPQLDAEAVMHLLRYDVRTLAVAADPAAADRLGRIGVIETVPSSPPDVVAAVRRVSAREVVADPEPAGRHLGSQRPVEQGRVVAVWGAAGSPGRTTVAAGLAGELAASGRSVVLVDADPYGGTVAQHLGVLDEISGLLAVARMANQGTLDEAALAGACRRVGDRLSVLTGLPRADRRVEVRPDVLGTVLALAAVTGEVVVDCGFCLEDPDVPLARDRMTLDALDAADEVLAAHENAVADYLEGL
jgi:Mrp family chromosome partitioning ATPase